MVDISLGDDLSTRISKYIADNANVLLCVPEIAHMIAEERLTNAEKMHFLDESSHSYDHTINHNMLGLRDSTAGIRPDMLLRILSTIGYIRVNQTDLKLLIIGPRSELEILLAYRYGWKPENVTAIDLMTYSPWIKLADMHDMRDFSDSSFDVIVAGWVLAYSSDNQKAAKEILRALKPGGYVAIGCVAEKYDKKLEAKIQQATGGIPMTSDDPERPGMEKTVSRYWRTSQIHKLFKRHIDRIVYDDTPDKRMRTQASNCMTVFKVTES